MALRDLVLSNRDRTGLVNRDNRDPLFALHDEMNRLFDDFSRGFGLPARNGAATSFGWPSIEVRENDQAIKVAAELPGLEQKDVEVLLADNVLTIRGEKRAENTDEKQQWSERYYGSFERRVPLDCDVDADKVKATFKNGLLSVEVPKSQQAVEKSRRISIAS